MIHFNLKCPLFLIAYYFFIIHISAQDPVFSQYYASPLQLNPGFAGHTESPFIAINHRRQWPTLGNAYITSAVSYDQAFRRINSGLGLSVLTDNAGNGIWRTNAATFYYSYQLRMNKETYVRLGLSAGILGYKIDWDRLIWYDQIDPGTGYTGQPTAETRPEQYNIQRPDFGAGVLFNNSRWWAGLSANHLNTPDFNFISENYNLNNGLSMRWTLSSGYQVTLREGTRLIAPVFLTPTILLTKQASAFQANVGLYASREPIFGGLFYRHTPNNPDAVIAMVGMKIGIFKFGYSYDVTISPLTFGISGGAHEASIIFNFDALSPKRDYNDCFMLFR